MNGCDYVGVVVEMVVVEREATRYRHDPLPSSRSTAMAPHVNPSARPLSLALAIYREISPNYFLLSLLVN